MSKHSKKPKTKNKEEFNPYNRYSVTVKIQKGKQRYYLKDKPVEDILAFLKDLNELK